MGLAGTARTIVHKTTRTAVTWALRGARVPLDAVERGARRAGVDVAEWYPARAFEGVAADTKRVIGQLVGDEALVGEGRRQRMRVEELRQAHMLRDEAHRLADAADARLERQRATTGRQREAIDGAARALERQREGERAVAKAAARVKAQRRGSSQSAR